MRVALLLLLAAPLLAATSEIKNGEFYVNGEPFYVRGIGYAPWRPHQRPGVSYVDTNRRWTDMDFERIKAAHFNTVRTWDALDPEELDLARKYGLMVLQGIRLDPHQNFSDIHNLETSIAEARTVAEQSKGHDNVLGYIVMTQPWPEAVENSGEAETQEYFRRLKHAIQEVDPRPVSMGSWLPLAFLNYGDFDFVAMNNFRFWPKSIVESLGFPGLIRWEADRLAGEKPLLIAETGGFSVSQASTSAKGGSGGLSEYDQSLKDLASLRDTVQGHADGNVLASWIDRWYAAGNPDTHDNEPWEWDGILGIPTDSKKDMDGLPRRTYRDAARFNEIILLEPRQDHYYGLASAIPIRAYSASNVAEVRWNINGSDWKPLEGGVTQRELGDGGWWQGFVRLPKLARHRVRLGLQALDENGSVLATTDVSFVAAGAPEKVEITSRPEAKRGAPAEFVVQILDGRRQPAAQRKVQYGFFYPISLREAQGSGVTDAQGHLTIRCPLPPQPNDRHLFVAAGTDDPDRVRAGDMKLFRLGR